MSTSPKFFLDGFQLGPHPISTRLPPELEGTGPSASADMSEAEKVERLRSCCSSRCSVLRRESAELDQSSLLRMQRQCELSQARTHCRQKALRIIFPLKADNNVIGIARENDLPVSVTASPPFAHRSKQ